MSRSFVFRVFGDPKGQPRPRAYARRMGSKFVARVYDSDVADDWKAAVDKEIAAINGINPSADWLAGPIYVSMRFAFARPKSHLRANGELKQSIALSHLQKPDADNCAKLVLDRMTASGRFWRDDSQVMHLKVTKQWADSIPSGCEIEVDWLA